jgi:hypothetical protein
MTRRIHASLPEDIDAIAEPNMANAVISVYDRDEAR